MRGLFWVGAALALTGCSGMSFRPVAAKRTGLDPMRMNAYAADFSVACEHCRVAYGREGELFHAVCDGSFQGSVALGTLRSGQKVRVVLRVTPQDDASVLHAAIEVDGQRVASADNKKPGQAINLSARVGPP